MILCSPYYIRLLRSLRPGWHGHDWERRKEDFKSNRDFWIKKIERNIERDSEVNAALQEDGWVVLRYWGKDIKQNTKAIVDEIQKVLEER